MSSDPPRRSSHANKLERADSRSSNLHRPFRLLLDDCCAISDAAGRNEIANANFDQVAAAKLAVDGEIKEGPVSQPALAVEHEADLPYLFGFQRPRKTLGYETPAESFEACVAMTD